VSSDASVLAIHAPGRVNLIGDHTDYTGGLVMPMAIDRGTTLVGTPLDGRVRATSDDEAGVVDIALPFRGDASSVEPTWGSFIAAVAAQMGSTTGFDGHLTSTVPAGAGLSSSAALMCAVAVGLGFDADAVDLAQLTRAAEFAATGVPTGIMDQFCIAAATAGHATLIDCHALSVEHVPIPDDLRVVVQFVAHRTLRGSEYADRVEECARAESEIGPLRSATLADVERIGDALIRRRARHVVNENQRVHDFADALRTGDYSELGRVLVAGHESLRDDFETSTPRMDDAVASLADTDGVFGARMTGGGFGGCVVALCEPDADVAGWTVSPAAGVRSLPPGDRSPPASARPTRTDPVRRPR
jgi:galactokinase